MLLFRVPFGLSLLLPDSYLVSASTSAAASKRKSTSESPNDSSKKKLKDTGFLSQKIEQSIVNFEDPVDPVDTSSISSENSFEFDELPSLDDIDGDFMSLFGEEVEKLKESQIETKKHSQCQELWLSLPENIQQEIRNLTGIADLGVQQELDFAVGKGDARRRKVLSLLVKEMASLKIFDIMMLQSKQQSQSQISFEIPKEMMDNLDFYKFSVNFFAGALAVLVMQEREGKFSVGTKAAEARFRELKSKYILA